MDILKKIGLVLAVGLLAPTIYTLVFVYSFNHTIGDKEYLANSITESGLYLETSKIIIKQATKDDPSNKLLSKSIATAASPENIQKITNPVIDASYAWLNGETKTPKIVINIDVIKDSFVKAYSKALKVRANTMPTCAYGQIPNLEDISKIDCIPTGTNVNQLIDEAIDQANLNNDVFSDSTTSDGNLTNKDAEDLGFSAPIDENTPETIPKVFQFVKKIFPYATALLALCLIGVIMLSKTKLHGARKGSITLLVSGIFLTISAMMLRFSIDNLLPTANDSSSQAPIESLKKLVETIFSYWARILQNSGIALFVIGLIGIIVATIFINKAKPKMPVDNKTPLNLEPKNPS